MTIGTIITTVQALDADDPSLWELSYSIRQAQPTLKKPLFSIDANSGKLRLARQIRPEDVNTHKLKIAVRDGPTPESKVTFVDLSLIVNVGSAAEMKAFEDKQSAGSVTNMVIIIIIIAVTLILAVVIMAVICLVRRTDKKRTPPRTSDNGNVMDSKLYHAAQWVSSVSIPNELGPEDNVKSTLEVPGEKKKKKEVSFSLDEEVVESPDTSGSLGSVFSPSPNTTQKDNGRPHKTGSREGGNGAGFILLNGMASPDYSQHLYQPRGSSTDGPDERQFIEVNRPGEDRYSDASSGDTGTSDSGRGGSEDESHAHTSSSVDGEPRQQLTSGNSSSSGIGSFRSPNADKRRYQRTALTAPPQQQQHNFDMEYIPGSPTPMLSEEPDQGYNTSPRLGYSNRPSGGSLRSLSASPSPSPSHLKYSNSTRNINNSNNHSNTLPPTHNNARITLSMNDCEGPYRVKKAEQHQQLLKTFSSPHSTTPPYQVSNSHPAWRRAKGLDTSWRSGQSSYPEEDDNTTTSGSYIINPDELTEESPYNPDIMV